MARIKLTTAAVERLRPPKTGRVFYFDKLLPAFAVRVSATGARSWIVYARLNRRLRLFTIDTLDRMPNVADAREAARALLRDVAAGKDPTAAKHAPPPPEAPAPEVLTVRKLVERFIAEYARGPVPGKPRNKTWRDTEGLLKRNVVSRWGDRAASSITRADVRAMLAEVQKDAPTGVNRTLAHTRKLFNWAARNDLVEASPVVGVDPPAKERPRHRAWTDAEMRAVWRSAETEGGVPGAFIRVLALLGTRRTETANMRWSQIDAKRREWLIPGDESKNEAPHLVPLVPLAWSIISALPRTGGDHVFTSAGHRRVPGKDAADGRFTDRDVPIRGFSKAKAKIWRSAGLDPKDRSGPTFHDLRRSVTNHLSRSGFPAVIKDRLLGHRDRTVLGRHYDVYEYVREKRAALASWAKRVERVVGERPTQKADEKVVSIARAREVRRA